MHNLEEQRLDQLSSVDARLDMRQMIYAALYVLLGLGLFAFAYYEYYDLLRLETEGGTRRLNRLIALGYELGGKWAVVALIVLGGIGSIYAGICKFLGYEDEDS